MGGQAQTQAAAHGWGAAAAARKILLMLMLMLMLESPLAFPDWDFGDLGIGYFYSNSIASLI